MPLINTVIAPHTAQVTTFMLSAKDFFTLQEQEAIVCAIRNAEMQTSGEVRVHIEDACPVEALDRAAAVFAALQLHKTKQRNGVLFYISVQDHRFALLGDAGINHVVPPDFWENIKNEVLQYFQQGKFVEGLVAGITATGDQLHRFFPYHHNDINELPDEISFGTD